MLNEVIGMLEKCVDNTLMDASSKVEVKTQNNDMLQMP